MFAFCIIISLASNLASTSIPPNNLTTPPPLDTTTTANAPTPTSLHQSNFITKLNLLANYIYNGLDYVAYGQQNISIIQHTNHRITTLSLDQLKIQHDLLKDDVKSSSEAIRWDQKGNHAVLKLTVQTAFEALKLEFENLVTEQRNLKAEQKSAFIALTDQLRVMKAENAMLNKQIQLGLNDSKTELKAELKTENLILNKQIQMGLNDSNTELKAELNKLKNENMILNKEIQMGLNDSKSDLTEQMKIGFNKQLNELKNENTRLNEQIQKSTKSELDTLKSTMKSQIQSVMNGVEKLVKAIHCGFTDGWLRFEDYCYKIVKKSLTAKAARAECLNLDAEPIRVRSESHNNILVKIMGKMAIRNIWIGLKQKGNKYTWPDGTNYKDSYYNFASGYPEGRDSVYMSQGDKKWYSHHGQIALPGYACEKFRTTA